MALIQPGVFILIFSLGSFIGRQKGGKGGKGSSMSSKGVGCTYGIVTTWDIHHSLTLACLLFIWRQKGGKGSSASNKGVSHIRTSCLFLGISSSSSRQILVHILQKGKGSGDLFVYSKGKGKSSRAPSSKGH